MVAGASESRAAGGRPSLLGQYFRWFAIVPEPERFTLAHYERCRPMVDTARTFVPHLNLHR